MKEQNIVFISDEKFLMATKVAVYSLISSRTDKHSIYNINCICKNVPNHLALSLKSLENELNRINIIDADCIDIGQGNSDRAEFGTHQKKSALLKFELAEIFADLDRILYLDGDIIVNGDISDLLDIDLGNHYLAAVYDNGKFCSNKIPDINSNQYFNSGVMLLNLAKMRKNDARDLLYKAKDSNDNNFFMDQNAFNKVFENDALLLSLKYNCQYVQIERKIHFNDLKIDTLNDTYGELYSNWEELKNDIRILHYTTPAKPWKYSDTPGVKLWDENYCGCGFSLDDLSRKKLNSSLIYKLCKLRLLRLPLRFIYEVKVRGVMTTIRRSFGYK